MRALVVIVILAVLLVQAEHLMRGSDAQDGPSVEVVTPAVAAADTSQD